MLYEIRKPSGGRSKNMSTKSDNYPFLHLFLICAGLKLIHVCKSELLCLSDARWYSALWKLEINRLRKKKSSKPIFLAFGRILCCEALNQDHLIFTEE